MELFAAIRRDADRGGVVDPGVGGAVRGASADGAAGVGVARCRRRGSRRCGSAPRLDPVKPLIDAMLRADLTAPRKQRHTARRVLARLVDEHGATDVSYSTVRDYVAKRRPEIGRRRAGRRSRRSCRRPIEPGAEAEVDFADLWVDLRGVKTKVFLFTLRLSYSGKAVHRAFATQGQEAFLEGHVHAFNALGGVPVDKIRYDNLKAAVSRVLFGRNRVESERWVAFRSHYGFDAFYCQPGIGRRPREGRRGRRGRPVPPQPSASRCRWWTPLAELNELLAAADASRRRPADREPRPHRRAGLRAGARRCCGRCRPRRSTTWLDADPAGGPLRPGHRPAVPLLGAGPADRPPGAGAAAAPPRCTVFDGRRDGRPASAGRPRRAARSLILDHYLEVLQRKPGALPGATALAQARAAGVFTAAHDAFWAAARKAPRRRRRHPGVDRGAAAAPAPAHARRARRHHRRAARSGRSTRTWSRSRPAKPPARPAAAADGHVALAGPPVRPARPADPCGRCPPIRGRCRRRAYDQLLRPDPPPAAADECRS